MDTISFPIRRGASLSMNSLLTQIQLEAERGGERAAIDAIPETSGLSFLRPLPAYRSIGEVPALSSLRIESSRPDVVLERAGNLLEAHESIRRVGGDFLSARVGPASAQKLFSIREVEYVDTKKRCNLHLNDALPSVGLVRLGSRRREVSEDGTGVLIGIIDSGFDLSHSAFWDKSRQRLRVEALWDQSGGSFAGQEFDTAELERQWRLGTGPGSDPDGHGTHVASIAGGTEHREYEGIAPGVRFLLVRGNMLENEDAVAWILAKAKGRPCVINLSYGHHFGAHDGTDGEERYHAKDVTGPGRIVVVSAGNERKRRIHLGKEFAAGEEIRAKFDIHQAKLDIHRGGGTLCVVLMGWYRDGDRFSGLLRSPLGKPYPIPERGAHTLVYRSPSETIKTLHHQYEWSNSGQIQVEIELREGDKWSLAELEDWTLELRCDDAGAGGRLDVWMGDDATARFHDHPGLVDEKGTIGIPATGTAALCAGSYVSRTHWESDDGPQEDASAVLNQPSSFSSMGPTRGGARKPEVVCPGQYITAALAGGSRMSQKKRRRRRDEALLTMEGTSMSAPVLAGTAALMLQKKNSLRPEDIRDILKKTAVRDDRFSAEWDEAFGFGRLDALKAVLAVL